MIGHTKAEGWNYFRNYNVRVVEKMIPVEYVAMSWEMNIDGILSGSVGSARYYVV